MCFILFLIHLEISTAVTIVRICLDDRTVEISWVLLPVVHRRWYFAANVLVLWFLHSFCPLFCNVFWAFVVGVTLRTYKFELDTPKSVVLCLWTVVVPVKHLQKETCLMREESSTILRGFEVKLLNAVRNHCFRNVSVVTSPVRSITFTSYVWVVG